MFNSNHVTTMIQAKGILMSGDEEVNILPIHIGRFYQKIGDLHSEKSCWLWKGLLNDGGYGEMRIFNSVVAAHRLSFFIHGKGDPSGMCVCHTCDTPACVNPNHLFLSTNVENTRDMVSKGRAAKGISNGAYRRATTLLNEEKVREIRELYRKGGHSHATLGRLFGVTGSCIGKIVTKKSWEFVE